MVCEGLTTFDHLIEISWSRGLQDPQLTWRQTIYNPTRRTAQPFDTGFKRRIPCKGIWIVMPLQPSELDRILEMRVRWVPRAPKKLVHDDKEVIVLKVTQVLDDIRMLQVVENKEFERNSTENRIVDPQGGVDLGLCEKFECNLACMEVSNCTERKRGLEKHSSVLTLVLRCFQCAARTNPKPPSPMKWSILNSSRGNGELVAPRIRERM